MDSLEAVGTCLPFVCERWISHTRCIVTPCGNIYLTGDYDIGSGGLVQTHIHAGRGASQCLKCNMEALSRMVSKDLKDGASKISVVRELSGLRCGQVNGLRRPGDALSCADGVAKALDRLPKTIGLGKDKDDGALDTR